MMERADIDCTLCQVRASGVFRCLEGPALRELDDGKQVQRFHRGQTVFYEGAPPLALYCIHLGTIKLFKTGEGGTTQVIRLLGAGEMIGYRPLLADEPCAATAEALVDSTLCVIPRELILGLIRSSERLALELLAWLARDLRISEDQLVSLTQHPVRQRTAQLLLFLQGGTSSQSGPGESTGIPTRTRIALRRKEMAQMIGTTPETLSRTLRDFGRQGLIRLTRAELVLEDVDGLGRIARAR
ncbi:MAG: Crp/Fnr family transcriptional regulator [Candidatus Eiseniibacteriota bacterium]|jgi:CRP/FNR family transcriptional regulator